MESAYISVDPCSLSWWQKVYAVGRGVLWAPLAEFRDNNTTARPGCHIVRVPGAARSAQLSVYPSNDLDCPALRTND